MRKILLYLLIFLLMSDIASASELVNGAKVVERNISSNSKTKLNDKPTRKDSKSKVISEANKKGKGSDKPIPDSEDDETVYLPPLEVPPMNVKPAPDGEQIEPPNIPDYSIPDVPTEPSKLPNTQSEPEIEEAEGLEFRMVNRDGVMAFAIIADHEKYKLKPVLARGHVPGRSTVKKMSDDHNAIAAINASYFSMNGEILGNTKIDGEVAGTTYYTRSTMAINSNGSTFFGRTNYYGSIMIGEKSAYIGGVDTERGADSVVIYNRHQGVTTGTNEYGVEYIVEGGIITKIFNSGNNEIPLNGYVVSLHGRMVELFKDAKIGDRVTFDQSFVDVDGAGDFDMAEQVIGAGPRLVKNGEVYVTVNEEQFPADIRVGRAPRSAVGVTKYGDYILAVVDGRQSHSKGCTLYEWAKILIDDFSAVEAINLDGGGSTELVVKGDIVNSPSDGRERPVGDSLVIIQNQK